MVDSRGPKSFAAELMEQDAEISDSSLSEQRAKIQETLTALDERARVSQRFAAKSIAAVVACYLGGLAFYTASSLSIGPGPAIATVWQVCTWAAVITAAVSVTRYWTIHRPRLERGRIDLHVAMFQELQRQISELKDKSK